MTVTTIPAVSINDRPNPSSLNRNLHQSSQLEYERRAAHKPNLQEEEDEHYVLTLLTDKQHHDTMTALRKQHFPAKLLKVDAHITLFHALPGSKLIEIENDIAMVAAQRSKFEIAAERNGVYEMSKGVGIRLDQYHDAQRKAVAIRSELRYRWAPFLSDQDRREKWRGHYTIMNKEDDREKVAKCLTDIMTTFDGSRGTVLGLRLWLYDRGWWREQRDFFFRE